MEQRLAIMPAIKRFFSFNRASFPLYCASMVMILLQSGLNAYVRIRIGRLFDVAIAGEAGELLNTLLPVLVVLVVLLVVVAFIDWLASVLSGAYSERCMRRMRDHTFAVLSASRLSWLESARTGDVVSRVNSDLNGFAGRMSNLLSRRLSEILFGVASLGACLWLNWKLSLICFTLIPLFGYLQAQTGKPIAGLTKMRSEADGRALAVASNLIGGMSIAKAFHLKRSMKEKFDAEVDTAVEVGVASFATEFGMYPFQNLMRFLPELLMLGIGGLFVLRGGLTPGELLAFTTLAHYVTGPISSLSWTIRDLYTAVGQAIRLFEIWDIPCESEPAESLKLVEPGEPFTPNPLREHHENVIQMHDMCFSYTEKEQLLDKVSFTVKSGECVALTGSSGSGKTTLLKLVSGFYNHSAGEIHMFGQPMQELDLSALRQRISYVNQEAFLFPGSIRDNVLIGKPDASEKELQQALEAAFISDLDIDKPVGERGVRLSGGQRQRVCIARAMLKNAEILLLDEPTSALDTESEFLVTQALDRLSAGRTTLIVGHRLSAIRQADRILCLENGRIVEEGTHATLMERNGTYRRLYESQMEECG